MESDDEESSISSEINSDLEDVRRVVAAPGSEGIQPYQFEPEPSDDEDDQMTIEAEEEQNDRLLNSDWCQCDNCQIMDRGEECVCCKEITAVVNTISDVPEGVQAPSCITQHPGFAAVCLNQWVLKTAWYQYKQQYNESFEGPQHKLNRHIAYRQLARWCWGFLGQNLRVVLPACAVSCIRAHFPPPGLEEYFNFEGFHHADE